MIPELGEEHTGSTSPNLLLLVYNYLTFYHLWRMGNKNLVSPTFSNYMFIFPFRKKYIQVLDICSSYVLYVASNIEFVNAKSLIL